MRRAPDAQPLYLFPTGPATLAADATAYLVKLQDRSPARCPFARVSRLILDSTHVVLDPGALRAALIQAHPIVFVDNQGQIRAQLLPETTATAPPADLLDEFFALPVSGTYYDDWLRHARALALSQVETGVSSRAARMARERLRRQFIHHLRSVPPLPPERALLSAAIAGLVAECIQERRLRARYILDDGRCAPLAADLRSLVLLMFHARAADQTRPLSSGGPWTLHELEHQRGQITGLLHRCISDLLRSAAEHVERGF
ncbi:hypothetical protein [Fontimonas thermophila]|uniref:hypothetical protein n=1 Tax=Fontimonas thermophila TaxID=1076937 RepID=UPI001F2FC810|nr:hypothetical protein [Fontimonas thermophila]